MALTESQILEELVHSVGCYKSALGPRALATLLVASSRMGILEHGKRWNIHVTIGYSDREDADTCVDVQEYGHLLRSLLDKKITAIHVRHVEQAN